MVMKRNSQLTILKSATIPMLLLTLLLSLNWAKATAQSREEDSVTIGAFPSISLLPNPLVIDEGRRNIPIITKVQWQQQRKWIKEEYQHWISGSVPPAPKAFDAKILSETVENGVKDRMVELSFGPNNAAKMTVEVLIPPSEKSLPVFLTQWSHRGWAQVAVRRGYIGCIYAGADGKDDTRNYSEIFPGYDFATLMKRAWGASRAIDYLYTLPQVDTGKIGITGHSRNGKQSLMAAAFDDRIKAVVSSSGGTGGESTFRFSDERFNSESLQEITHSFPHWFDSRLPLFTGREEKLPVDQNSLMSVIAPRGLMVVSSISEDQGNPWGIEHSYKSAKTVYHFLNADSHIAIWLRRGRHQHSARDVETFIDFFDYIFGRSKIAPENRLFYDYSFDKWKKQSGEKINPLTFAKNSPTAKPKAEAATIKNIHWLLGDEPRGVNDHKTYSANINRNHSYTDDYIDEIIGEPNLPDNIRKMTIGPYHGIGDDLWASMYFPATSVVDNKVVGKLPVVIFLHDFAYATGYHRRSIPMIEQLIKRGFAVLAYDLVGFGSRVEEASHFYDRYPHWSMMGKMVADTRSIVNDICDRMPFIDSTNIFLTGYSLGGTVALFTAALDTRVKGVAVLSAFSSLRNDNKETEGIRRYADLHGLIPRLGFFEGNESRIPVDFNDIISCIAPRNLLIIAPQEDRHHSISSVRNIISAVKEKYQQQHATDKLTFLHPETYNHYPLSMKEQMADWLMKVKDSKD